MKYGLAKIANEQEDKKITGTGLGLGALGALGGGVAGEILGSKAVEKHTGPKTGYDLDAKKTLRDAKFKGGAIGGLIGATTLGYASAVKGNKMSNDKRKKQSDE